MKEASAVRPAGGDTPKSVRGEGTGKVCFQHAQHRAVNGWGTWIAEGRRPQPNAIQGRTAGDGDIWAVELPWQFVSILVT